MKAIQSHEFNAVSDLIPRVVKTPEPKTGEVLVRVDYAAINPSDLKNFQGSMTHTALPRIIGRDFSGEIVKGPKHRIGEKVWGTGGDLGFERDGTHAEYVVVPEGAAVTLPEGFDPAQAATLGVPYVTAMSAIERFGRNLKGKTVLIVGGTGAVGSAATIIARARGAAVIRTTCGEVEVLALDPSLREGRFIDVLDGGDLQQEVMELTKGRGVDFAFNMVGGATFESTLNSLAEFGSLVTIASSGDHRVGFNLLQFYRKQLAHYGVNTLYLDSLQSGALLRKVMDEVASQIVPFARIDVHPFDNARTVFVKMMEGKIKKAVLSMVSITSE
jgi:NADPH:quinone reductase